MPFEDTTMVLIAIAGGLLLACGLVVRELQLARERNDSHEALRRVCRDLEGTRAQLLRAREDLYVLKAALEERNVVTDAELSSIRTRLIEAPRRRAREREQLTRSLELSSTSHLIVDEGENVH